MSISMHDARERKCGVCMLSLKRASGADAAADEHQRYALTMEPLRARARPSIGGSSPLSNNLPDASRCMRFSSTSGFRFEAASAGFCCMATFCRRRFAWSSLSSRSTASVALRSAASRSSASLRSCLNLSISSCLVCAALYQLSLTARSSFACLSARSSSWIWPGDAACVLGLRPQQAALWSAPIRSAGRRRPTEKIRVRCQPFS